MQYKQLKNTLFAISIYNKNNPEIAEYVCYKYIKDIDDNEEKISSSLKIEKNCYNINDILYNNPNLVIFGGVNELRRLESLNLDINNISNLIDLQDIIWINNSEYTNPSFEYCIKEILNKEFPAEYNLSRYSYIEDEEQNNILNNLINDIIKIYILSYKDCFKHNVYKIDSNIIKTLLNIENREKRIDINYLKTLKRNFENRIKNSESEIYLLREKKININSIKDISDILEDYGIDFLDKTKTGLLKNSNDILDIAYSYTNADILSNIIKYRKHKSYYINFIQPIMEFIEKNKTKGCRFCYRPYSTQTGRLCSSKVKGSNFYTQISIQTIPKEIPRTYYMYRLSDFKDKLFSNNKIIDNISFQFNNFIVMNKIIEENSLPYKEIKGFELDNNIRKCFIPNPDCYWVSIDYKSQEVNVVTKLYHDKELFSASKNNDIYTYIGNKILNEFNIETNLSTQEFRNKIKVIVLGIIYGMNIQSVLKNIHSLSNKTKKTNELELIKEERKLKKIFKNIINGQQRTLDCYRVTHKCYSFFNRPRNVDINKQDKLNIKKTKERQILNMPIQGTCADIMRIVLSRIENEVTKDYKYYGFDIMNSIHDEINFSIPKKFYKEIIKKILTIMKNPVKTVDFNLNCSIYIGNNWGEIFQFPEKDIIGD